MAAVNNSFENLEQIPKQVVKQVTKLPGAVVVGGLKSVVGQPMNQGGVKTDPLTGIEIPSPQRVAQLQKQEKKIKRSGIPNIQQFIQGMQKQSGSNIPAYIAGKPGFSEEKAVKQMQGVDPEKKKLPPPVSTAKRKGGTGERRGGMGVGG